MGTAAPPPPTPIEGGSSKFDGGGEASVNTWGAWGLKMLSKIPLKEFI